jgi:ATP-binding cassette subfamily F protein 3
MNNGDKGGINSLIKIIRPKKTKKQKLEETTLNPIICIGNYYVDKKIKVLSGGEKARVALAKTIVSKANFLILDEPTNHLDMHSVELLAEALNKYEGSYILVSHDRYFISKTANKIWEIVDQQIKEFKGTYQEWVEWNERMEKQKKSENATNNATIDNKPAGQKKVDNPPTTSAKNSTENFTPGKPINKEAQKELQKQQKKLANIEESIGQAQQEKKTLEAELGNPDIYTNKEQFSKVETAYNLVQKKLTDLNKDYEVQFEVVMGMEG